MGRSRPAAPDDLQENGAFRQLHANIELLRVVMPPFRAERLSFRGGSRSGASWRGSPHSGYFTSQGGDFRIARRVLWMWRRHVRAWRETGRGVHREITLIGADYQS